MTTIMQGLTSAPLDMTHGVPMGVAGYEGYKFATEIAIVTPENKLPFLLGTSKLGGPRWKCVTPDVQGISWNRGSEPAQRPIAGQLQLRLLDINDAYSPFTDPFHGPGTLVRTVVSNGVVTHPQFTGLTVSWVCSSSGLATGGPGYEWCDVTAYELSSLLSDSNENALSGVVGYGETLTQRVQRLLTKAEWQFGSNVVTTSPATFQSTDLAQDMSTELYRVVDSVDAVAFPGKNGDLFIRDRATGTGVSWTVTPDMYDPDTFTSANDDDRILSSVDLARVGGTTVSYVNAGMAARYQKRTVHRNDLITIEEAGNADLQRVATGMLARSDQTYRPVSFDIESGFGPLVSTLLIESDITDRITVERKMPSSHAMGSLVFADYSIIGINTSVQVAGAGTYWKATLTLDIEADSAWSLVPA